MSNTDKTAHPTAPTSEERSIWMRGALMLVFAFFFGIAEALLMVAAVVQFVWMGVTKERNQLIVDFGHSVGEWLKQVALFQSGASDDLPFPWAQWDND
ncbi:MAG: lipase [Hyphomicrobiales bacterium]|nr:DUF4389 domain-containing protein [Hyphomicrobiales bacterium]PCJ83345.1 MAG: lipase [Hyphomicrobiales bacterium]